MSEPSDLTLEPASDPLGSEARGSSPPYDLDAQVGFLLRRAQQRHLSIFNTRIAEGLTAQQFAVLVKISDTGGTSQNALGRQTAMDQSTINGVVQRLIRRGLVRRDRSATDRRMILLDLTEAGHALLFRMLPVAREITRQTLAPLSEREQARLLDLLRRIG
ncbi:MAG: MarR family transcriptional regulator [Jannaschia sp.]